MKPIWIDPKRTTDTFTKHRFLNENYIVSIVSTAIQTNKIDRVDETHFQVKSTRKENSDLVQVICWVHEREDCYWVGKIHVQPIK